MVLRLGQKVVEYEAALHGAHSLLQGQALWSSRPGLGDLDTHLEGVWGDGGYKTEAGNVYTPPCTLWYLACFGGTHDKGGG